jgi:hypothetical protein
MTEERKGGHDMSIGTLVFLLLIGGSLVAMLAMHRGGQSHGMGMGMGCGAGHNHGSADHSQPEASQDHVDRPLLGAAAAPAHAGDAAIAASRHRGC